MAEALSRRCLSASSTNFSNSSRCRSPGSDGAVRLASLRPSCGRPCRPVPLRFLGSKSERGTGWAILDVPFTYQSWASNFVLASRIRARQSGWVLRSLNLVQNRAGGESVGDAWTHEISFQSQSASVTEGSDKRCTESIDSQPGISSPSEIASIQQDAGLVCLVLLGAYLWVRVFDFFTSRQILDQKLSRKIVHITSGLLYMLSWPIFSSSKWAPFIVGMVPLANAVRLMIYGFGIRRDEGLVKSMSRSGESRELLRGPLYYVVVLYLSTILFWRHSPVGAIALSMMCAGDGIADIMGRKFGSVKLPYNKDKSFAGSVSMFLFGLVVSSLFVYYFTAFKFFELDFYDAAVRLALISLAATTVESLPFTAKLDDNFTVPATTFLLGILFFPSQ